MLRPGGIRRPDNGNGGLLITGGAVHSLDRVGWGKNPISPSNKVARHREGTDWAGGDVCSAGRNLPEPCDWVNAVTPRLVNYAKLRRGRDLGAV